MLDFHTHILPGVDDGAVNLEMSLKMIEEEKKAGITDIILTPHFYCFSENLDSFLEKRSAAFSLLSSAVEGVNLHLGAEVYYSSMLNSLDGIEQLCIAGTEYMLIEIPYRSVTRSLLDDMRTFITDGRFIPVFAHIERYRNILPRGCFEEIMDLNVLMQCNYGALSRMSDRRFIINEIKKGTVRFMGSDCHNNDTRAPNCADGMKRLQSKSPEAMEIIKSAASSFLAGRDIY